MLSHNGPVWHPGKGGEPRQSPRNLGLHQGNGPGHRKKSQEAAFTRKSSRAKKAAQTRILGTFPAHPVTHQLNADWFVSVRTSPGLEKELRKERASHDLWGPYETGDGFWSYQ